MERTNGTGFRNWLNQMWMDHKDEVYETTGKPCDYDLGVYFGKYKWWLKRMYKLEYDRNIL